MYLLTLTTYVLYRDGDSPGWRMSPVGELALIAASRQKASDRRRGYGRSGAISLVLAAGVGDVSGYDGYSRVQ